MTTNDEVSNDTPTQVNDEEMATVQRAVWLGEATAQPARSSGRPSLEFLLTHFLHTLR